MGYTVNKRVVTRVNTDIVTLHGVNVNTKSCYTCKYRHTNLTWSIRSIQRVVTRVNTDVVTLHGVYGQYKELLHV